jgi:hypothetical protein
MLPAPTIASSPIVTPGRMIAPPPIQTLAPIVTGPPEAHLLPPQLGVPRVIGGEDLNSRTDGRPFADHDRLDVQDDAVEVEEGSWPERDVETVIAVEGRAYDGILADRSEPLDQQRVSLLVGQAMSIEALDPPARRTSHRLGDLICCRHVGSPAEPHV